jgi:medium-chain acyl-[acyl-carrier-protein] hydrolase
VLPWITAPFALFGHSLGAIVAAEAARRLEALDVAPVWVGVSGRPGPSQQAGYDLHSSMSDEGLMRVLDGNGGIPEQIKEMPDFRDRFLRLVRDNLRAVESYRPAPGRRPLAAPMTAFAGDRDPLAPPSAVAAWAQETRGHFRLRTFAGGHFYFRGPAFPVLAAAVTGDIERAVCPALPRPGGRGNDAVRGAAAGAAQPQSESEVPMTRTEVS